MIRRRAKFAGWSGDEERRKESPCFEQRRAVLLYPVDGIELDVGTRERCDGQRLIAQECLFAIAETTASTPQLMPT